MLVFFIIRTINGSDKKKGGNAVNGFPTEISSGRSFRMFLSGEMWRFRVIIR